MVLFWVGILALSILLYVLLDGFDLGVGILFGLTQREDDKSSMISAVSPVWDGNETWLIVSGVVLWAAFPPVYSVTMSAFYLPVLVMLAGLILRGVAFEFRLRSARLRWVWNTSFALGSLIATFMQGVMVGALVQGLNVRDLIYVGGDMDWLTPFSVVCGIGLCVGYALLGASWLVTKTEGAVREAAYHKISYLVICLFLFLSVVFVYALWENLRVMERWLERPYLVVFPLLGALAAIALWRGVSSRRDAVSFAMVSLIFIAAFGTLALSFWPYMIPFSISIKAAAAPPATLSFIFWGAGLFVFPIMLIYTIVAFSVFRGKVRVSTMEY